jgi:CxxC-x17-CxxC domain-containing protein
MEVSDRTIRCLNCGKDFVFSVRDQKYYEKLGFKNAPKRCRECRALLKRERQFSTRSDGSTKEFFKVICAACGRPAYVPFKPTGIKPVYCRDCLVATKIREHSGESKATGEADSAPPPV